MGIIEGLALNSLTKWAIGSVAGVIVAWILKSIPNEKIKKVVGKTFYGLGVAMTLGISKKFPKLWNKTVEPFVVDLIDNVVGEAVKQFIHGLRSDNDE